MITRPQMKEIGYETLIEEFSADYIYENSEKKLKDIIAKVGKSKKVLELMGVLYNQKAAPKSQEILIMLYSIGYFMFAKSETLCMGSIIFVSTWYEEFNKKLNIISDDEFTDLVITIIMDCDKRKTHINVNFFSRYFIKLTKRQQNNNYLQHIVSLFLNSKFYEDFKNFEEENPREASEYVNELFEYRKFKIILMCSILYQLKAQEKFGELPNHIYSKIINDTQHLILPFYQNFIITDKLIINFLSNDNSRYLKNGLLLIFNSEFGGNGKDILTCLETGDAFWIEKYQEFANDDFISEKNHYYRFIMELFAIKIELNYHDKLTVRVLTDDQAYGLDGVRLDLIDLLPATLKEIYNLIEIREEDFK